MEKNLNEQTKTEIRGVEMKNINRKLLEVELNKFIESIIVILGETQRIMENRENITSTFGKSKI